MIFSFTSSGISKETFVECAQDYDLVTYDLFTVNYVLGTNTPNYLLTKVLSTIKIKMMPTVFYFHLEGQNIVQLRWQDDKITKNTVQ